MFISVCHSKGGVGKSGIAANLSVHLHQKGHNVACIDLDGGEWGNQSLTAKINNSEPEIRVEPAETVKDVRDLIPKLVDKYHFIIVDAPAGFSRTGDTNIELLRHTDFALIPVLPEIDTIEPLAVVEEVIEAARKDNPLLEARVILNKVDKRTKSGRDVTGTLKSIEQFAPTLRVMKQSLRVDQGAYENSSKGNSVVMKWGSSTGKKDLEALFDELLNDMIVSINRHDQRNNGRKEKHNGRKVANS